MKSKFLASLLSLSAIFMGVQGSAQADWRNPFASNCCDTSCCERDWSFEIRGAAFLPLNSDLSDIYDSGWPTLEFEGTYDITKNVLLCGDDLLAWVNVGWTPECGNTKEWGYQTKLNLVPLSAGLEYAYNIYPCLDVYVGAGVAYSWLMLKNFDGFDTHHRQRSNVGGVAKSGFRYQIWNNFFIDVFADYYYTKFNDLSTDWQSIEGNFSGFFVGGGLGYKF